MNSLRKILAQTAIAFSLLSSPIYSQDFVKEQIKTEAKEGIINAAIESGIRKPNREKIIEKNFKERTELIQLNDPQSLLPPIPVYIQSATLEQYTEIRKEIPYLISGQKENKFGFGFGTYNSRLLMAKNFNKNPPKFYVTEPIFPSIPGFNLPGSSIQELMRINKTDTRVYLFHHPSIKIKSQAQDAEYLSGKQERLKPLEETSQNAFLEKSEQIILEGLERYGLTGAEENYKSFKEKSKAREQKVMNDFAKEINPEYEATKVELYPSKIWGDTEVFRAIALELEKPENQKEKPFAVFIKPSFQGNQTVNGTENATLEGILLNGSY